VAVNAVTNTIYVANSGSNSLTVIDGATNTTSTIIVGQSPKAVAVNPVTNKIYVANGDGSVTVIDGVTNATVTMSMNTIDLTVAPSAVAVNPVTNKIYVAADNVPGIQHGRIGIIDGATNAIQLMNMSAVYATGIAVNSVTNKIYVASVDLGGGAPIGVVTIIDGVTNATTVVGTGNTTTGVAVNPVTNKIYVTDKDNFKVRAIDGTNNAITDVTVGVFPMAVAVNTQTNKIYVPNLGSNNVTVIDGSNNTTTTVSAGTGPTAVAVNETTNTIYVLNHDSNNVTVIHGSDNSTTTVSVGTGPRAATVNPTTNAVYVANATGNSVSVIDGPTSFATDFALNASPLNPSLSPILQPGTSATSVISTSAFGGFNADVSLSLSGLPPGVTATFSSTTVPAPGSGNSTLTLSASATTAFGTYTIPITASGGGLTHTLNIALTIVNPGYFVTASPSSLTVKPGSSANTTVTVTVTDNSVSGLMFPDITGLPAGVTASFSPPFINGNGSLTLTLTANNTAAAGTSNVTVLVHSNRTPIGTERTATVGVTVDPGADFGVSASPATLQLVLGNSNSTTVTISAGSLFNSDISLSASGLPAGVTAIFSPATIPAPGSGNSTLTFTASNSATPGNANVTVTATGGGKTHTSTLSLVIVANTGLVYTFPAATTVSSIRVVTEGVPNLDYAAGPGTTCTTQTYNAGDSCTVVATFFPKAPGLRKGAVQIVNSAGQPVFQTLLSNVGGGAEAVLLPGTIFTAAGLGTAGFSGDGGPATSAKLNEPFGIAVDPAGNKIIADLLNHRIRGVNATGTTIATIAGNGTPGFGGDGGLTINSELNQPLGVALDGAGNLYIADADNDLIRKIDAVTGIITTVAGNGTAGDSGDGGPATSAELFFPFRVAVDGAGNLYIADTNDRIRRVDAATGIITTVAGSGIPGFSGDNGPATAAQLDGPRGVALDAAGNLYIAEYFNSRIRKVDAATGIITTVAGDGHLPGDGTIPPSAGLGDGGFAINAHLHSPSAVAVDAADNLYIADSATHVIRKVDAASGIINRVAGQLDLGQGLNYNGDNQAATLANLRDPDDIALDDAGNLYIADALQQRVRKVMVKPSQITLKGAPSPTTALTVSNIGNQPLNFTSITVSANFGIDNGVTTCSTANPVAPGSSCLVGVFFAPQSGNNLSGSLSLIDNSMNGTTQTVTLFGMR
jgi:YVTN family beta-propeller protein